MRKTRRPPKPKRTEIARHRDQIRGYPRSWILSREPYDRSLDDPGDKPLADDIVLDMDGCGEEFATSETRKGKRLYIDEDIFEWMVAAWIKRKEAHS